MQVLPPGNTLLVPLAHFTQEVGSHDDKEMEPAGHVAQVNLVDVPTAVKYVPEEQGKQPLPSPLAYVPATHVLEQIEDPAAENVPMPHSIHGPMLDALIAVEKVPALQGVHSPLTR